MTPIDHNRSRDKLLRAATTLFAAYGYHGTSTQQIAGLAGVNQATVFRVFHSKQALFQRVLERCIRDNAIDWIEKALKSSRQDKVVFRNLANGLDKVVDPTFVRLTLFCALEQPSQLQKLLRPSLHSFSRQVGGRIKQCIADGTLRELDPASVCWALVAMVVYKKLLVEMVDEGKTTDRKEEKPHLQYLDIWLNGVLANPSKALPARRLRGSYFKRSAQPANEGFPRTLTG